MTSRASSPSPESYASSKKTRLMISIAFYVLLLFIAVSGLYCGMFLLLMVENHRFWRRRSKQAAPTQPYYPRVHLIIPCKGMEPGLRQNLLAFVRQDYGNYEITFVVESGKDPATALIRSLKQNNRFQKINLVISGISESCGQKVHNLRAAVNQLGKDVEVLVFADSDAMPANNWLRWMVSGLNEDRIGARTGYRWMVPEKNNLPTLLACTLNNSVAALMGPGSHFPVWGGSWAIQRRIFEQSGMKQAWFGVLSDDLVATNVIRHSGLEIRFEPRCLCASPVQFSWGQLIEFLYRQLLIVKKYTPRFWLSALTLIFFNQVAFWGSVVGSIVAFGSGSVQTGMILVASAMTLSTGSILRSLLRQKMGRFAVPDWRKQKTARLIDIMGSQFAGLFALAIIIASAFGSRIRWRGIGYHISRGGRIQMLGRQVDEPLPVDETTQPAGLDCPSIKVDTEVAA